MKDTIKPEGRHHSIPRNLYGFVSDLELTAGVEEVRGGRFLHRKNYRNFEARIQHYNETTRILRVKVRNKKFIAYFSIRIKPEARQEVEDYITDYNPNGHL
jgi:hypothetical protein